MPSCEASTNKGGVTSSSHEVLAALAMSDEEFAEHMQVKPGKSPPTFYQVYVQQVMERIRENARLEFNALWNESIRTGKPRCDLTDVLSVKILRLKRDIRESDSLWNDTVSVRKKKRSVRKKEKPEMFKLSLVRFAPVSVGVCT